MKKWLLLILVGLIIWLGYYLYHKFPEESYEILFKLKLQSYETPKEKVNLSLDNIEITKSIAFDYLIIDGSPGTYLDLNSFNNTDKKQIYLFDSGPGIGHRFHIKLPNNTYLLSSAEVKQGTGRFGGVWYSIVKFENDKIYLFDKLDEGSAVQNYGRIKGHKFENDIIKFNTIDRYYSKTYYLYETFYGEEYKLNWKNEPEQWEPISLEFSFLGCIDDLLKVKVSLNTYGQTEWYEGSPKCNGEEIDNYFDFAEIALKEVTYPRYETLTKFKKRKL